MKVGHTPPFGRYHYLIEKLSFVICMATRSRFTLVVAVVMIMRRQFDCSNKCMTELAISLSVSLSTDSSVGLCKWSIYGLVVREEVVDIDLDIN